MEATPQVRVAARQARTTGTIQQVEFVDDRWRDGLPHRVITMLESPVPPQRPDPRSIRTDIGQVLDGPSTFQAGAASVLVLLRRYLERIERLDQLRGRIPRVRIFNHHRVIIAEGDGFVDVGDGRLLVRVEELQEFDFKGKFVRVRAPGSAVIDVGVPELFMVAEGFHSTDALRLGFHQHDVEIDHHDGRGPVVAQADFLAGLIEALVGGRLRRRISSEFDDKGHEYWVRQIAVGHEDDPEVGWVLVQVPDFKSFDPVEAGILPEDTDRESPAFFAAYQNLLHDYYLEQAADILEIPKHELKQIEMVYGPKLFSLIERVGDDALVAANGVVAGDSFGNGHFLTSGGAITGMVGHSARVLRYWRDRDGGTDAATAIRALADGIKVDTEAWLEVSAREYREAAPINFGAERIAELAARDGASGDYSPVTIEAARRQRHSLLPLDPSDWRRLFLRNGAVRSLPLPDLHTMHPALRPHTAPRQRARTTVVAVMPHLTPDALRLVQSILDQPAVKVWLVSQVGHYLLPEAIHNRLTGYWRLADTLGPHPLEEAVRSIAAEHGNPDVLLATEDGLAVMLGEVRDALGIAGQGGRAARRYCDKAAMVALLRHAGLPLAIDEAAARAEGATRCSFDVMSIGGIPAWWSATRESEPLAGATALRTITLPREVDDPADASVRRMGLAALRTLGVSSGITSVTLSVAANGGAAIVDVAVRPPSAAMMLLMNRAHDTDMYQAWADATIRGQFAPIHRVYAAGMAYLPPPGNDDSVWDDVRAELGDLVVDTVLPPAGDRRGPPADPYVIVRHPETAVVDEALRRVVGTVQVALGS